MSIESGELRKVKDEWEARFARLPIDTDVSQIDEPLRLRWRALPKCRSLDGGTRPENVARARQRGGPLDGVSPALENPPINPLTGQGRTNADVARETNAWRAYVRQQAHELEPVYQSDYLFVLPPNQTLQLHRVASGAFVEDALSPSIHFQTSEYRQTPNTQLGGFWGEFTLKPNPNYNPQNVKMGGVYVRHNEISRSQIVLYNVQVVPVKRPPPPPGQKPVSYIRVLASSLARLSQVCPEFAMPSELPESHADDDVETAAGGADAAEGETAEDSDDEDPPPPIPDGFQQVASSSLVSISHFLLWSTVERQRARWHHGVVTKVYPANYTFRGRPYTHDAKLDGSQLIRGVNLTPELEEEGMWVALQATAAPPPPPLPPPSPSPPCRSPSRAPGGVREGQNRVFLRFP